MYTSRFTGGRNSFEYLLAYLGIRQKNGSPGHPQTQGKIERFHQTLKRWLGQQPAARTTSPSSRRQLDAFRLAYNEQRPHRAIGRVTPGEAYRATPEGASRRSRRPRPLPPPLRRRRQQGRHRPCDGPVACTTSRSARPTPARRVLAIVDEQEVTVVALDTGEILSAHRIEPDKGYWRNTRRDPGRWPGSQATG